MTLFYADDDPDDREIFCDAVRQIDHRMTVTLAKDGYEAFEMLTTGQCTPDFIFMDVNMPRMNGIECLGKLKADTRLKTIPVIIYSTTTNKSEVKRYIMLGANDFIPKAHSFQKLKESIQKVLKKEFAVH